MRNTRYADQCPKPLGDSDFSMRNNKVSLDNAWEGCQKVGPGCDHCYAETRNQRSGGGVAPNWGPGAPRRRTSAANWRKMFRWNAAHAAFAAVHGRRQRVFCASLADVFDTAVPIEWLIDVLDVWRQTPHLDKLVLTKRIGNATKRLGEAFNTLMLRDDCAENPLVPWLATWIAGNAPADIWLGATIVNQAEADRDIPKLLRTPAKTRFLSMEPLLGHVDVFSSATGELLHTSGNDYEPGALDWIIVGGESGAGARSMHPAWARSLRDQCASAGVPFLFKQWGHWQVVDGSTGKAAFHAVGKKASGRLLDGVVHDAFPVTSLDVGAACGRALARGAK
ncbi:conserved hypothetical protein (plasmid backbone) PHG324 (plasmid) [Cupriavidus metallidurans CH34]|uniref:Phage Gp37/Gp68 family protein n=3 Tax=Cupriavidus metallidurans TaxID=119219 RepID=Q1L9Q3_CUPMC|nr:conserved hypothetical protein (plasmid backbone) PHG324 [Cupriavidus metallidurans CH34]